MFRLIEPSSDQIQNTVPVHSVSAHIMGSQTISDIWQPGKLSKSLIKEQL